MHLHLGEPMGRRAGCSDDEFHLKQGKAASFVRGYCQGTMAWHVGQHQANIKPGLTNTGGCLRSTLLTRVRLPSLEVAGSRLAPNSEQRAIHAGAAAAGGNGLQLQQLPQQAVVVVAQLHRVNHLCPAVVSRA